MKEYKQLSKKPQIYLINFPQKTDEVFLDIFFHLGKIFEGKKYKGCGHAFEHYVLGVVRKKYTAHRFRKMNGNIGKELLSFYIESKKRKIVSDAKCFLKEILCPDFSHRDVFSYEIKSIKNEWINLRNDPEYKIFRKVQEFTLGRRCPYVYLEVENLKEIEKLSLGQVESYYKELLIHSEPIFFIGGYKLDGKLISELTKIIFENVASFKFKKLQHPECQVSEGKKKIFYLKDIKDGAYAFVAFPASPRQSRDPRIIIGTKMLSRIIIGSSKFGILEKIRQRGIYSVDYRYWMGQRVALLSFFSHLSNDQVDDFVHLLKSELDFLKKNEISKSFFSEIVSNYRKWQKKDWGDNVKRYSWIIENLIWDGEVTNPKGYSKIYSRISSKFLKSLAKKIFDWNKANLIIFKKG